MEKGKEKHNRDTRGTGCRNEPSIPIMVEQTTNNNEQTSQADSFGKGIKEINQQDNPLVHASHQESWTPWIYLWSHTKQLSRLRGALAHNGIYGES
jgi:hypothetical protein